MHSQPLLSKPANQSTFAVFFSCVCILLQYQVQAQQVGIGISTPLAKLHIKSSNPEILRIEGESPYISFYSESPATYSGYLWHDGATMRLGTSQNLPVYLYGNYNVGSPLTVMPNGNVGILNTTPQYRLDIPGLMRIRHNQATAGIWFNNSTNTQSPGFIGMYNDSHLGFYSSFGGGWGMRTNTTTGNVGIGVDPGTATLQLDAPGGIAIEIEGKIKMSGAVKPAFRVTATATNLSDLDFRGNYTSIIIDHPFCNSNPQALLFATPVIMESAQSWQLRYDAALAKWKIRQTVQNSSKVDGFTNLGYRDVNNQCTTTDPVVVFSNVVTFREGDAFNILIINR